ncbi:cellulose binding domain-containing protein [Actinoplanes sp. KI2]|uniref:cellulose binding domain-containing protein n=1 Tax=Actinoplanes sp. KI2 TaxID=2983315 RepID=UPI0021D5A81F|nr:cellulose binding domain-containing protein [Actinoplanes sp. KI2]MCU7731149.1 cellulose binding domain-containing protein [Actinoplanes sp. KI2]
MRASVRPRLAAFVAATTLVAGLGVTLSAHAATVGCSVAYSVTSQWPGGFGANVSITDLGDPITGWTLTWSYAAGQKVTQAWNATVSQNGAQVTARNVGYNGTIGTGSSVTFGFNGSWTGSNPAPVSFALNGTTCTGSVISSGPTSPTPTSASPTPSTSTSPGSPDDWPTYHRDNARDGNAPNAAPLSTLSVAWTASLDGAVYGQPLVVGGRIFAATENDTVYALSPATGAVLWSTHVGQPEPLSDLPCGNINPLGITSTMVYDPATNRVFAVAETTGGAHTLLGINANTGAVEVRTAVEPPLGDPKAHQQRGALTLLNGRVYLGYGGLFGDCGQYIGAVVSVTTAGTGKTSYAVPTTREAGIWGTAGGVVDGDHLLYAVGNGESTTTYDGSDSVLALSAGLQRTDFFAPSDWASQNAGDADLGSMSPALVGQYVYADGKAGIGYVLRHDNLGGIGGQVSQLANGCQSFGGSAVSGSTVYLPCTTGPRAVTIAADGTARELWRAAASVPAEGSPVIGGGAVWVVDYNGGVLYALDPGTGAALAQVRVGQAPNFTSPTLSGNRAYVGTRAGVTAVNGI